jgi:hypothetical protein
MKKYSFCIVLFCSLFQGCVKRHKYTLKVCDDKLYVESFNINPAGVDADYLTDSINFRIYVGDWDNEHENFTYECKGDSVFIEKIDASGVNFRVLETKVFAIKDLKHEKKL